MIKMLNKILNFWRSSYESDRVAFAYELLSFVFTVGASLTLALTADSPSMEYIYPGFFIGSVAGLLGYWRRGLAWPFMLTTYFAFVNVFGYGVAVGWW